MVIRSASRYSSFGQVEVDAKNGVFRNESELRRAFVKALKEELLTVPMCKRLTVVDLWFRPLLDEALKGRRPDIRIANLVIEVEAPRAGLEVGRRQLHKYMEDVHSEVKERVEVYGLVTDGVTAELWMFNGTFVPKGAGSMAEVSRRAIEVLCAQEKIPVVRVEDLVWLFGV